MTTPLSEESVGTGGPYRLPDGQIMSSQSPLIVLSRYVGIYRTLTKTFYDIGQNRCYANPTPGGHIIGFSHGNIVMYMPRGNGIPLPSIVLLDFFTGMWTWLHYGEHVARPYRILLSSHPSSPDFLAVYIFGSERMSLRYWRAYGAGRWNIGLTQPAEDITDIIFFKNRLYALTRTMELGVLDPVPTKITILKAAAKSRVEMVDVSEGQTCCFLAESGGELLVVGISYKTRILRARSKVERCCIWRWDFESGGGWDIVSNLAGRAVFIGPAGSTGSISISVSARSGIRDNCIYFIDRKHCSWLVYSLEERSFHEIHPSSPPGFEIHWAEPREPLRRRVATCASVLLCCSSKVFIRVPSAMTI